MTQSEIEPQEFPEPGNEGKGGVLGHTVPTREEESRHRAVLEQKQFITGRISESVRYIGFGLLIVFYTVISSETAFARRVASEMPLFLKAMGLLGVLAVVFDYLQYVCGNFSVRSALRVTGPNAYLYNRDWISHRLHGVCYVLKQVFILGGCIALIVILVGVA